MLFSIIIPVFNRPDEIKDLLESLSNSTKKNFEVIIVEDGSEKKSNNIINLYKESLNIKYIEKTNSGPGDSRNTGAKEAKGEYLIFFDSDCIIPYDYLQNVILSLDKKYSDAYGGADKAMSSFSTIQKAINYSMTSFLTTGGIRGKIKSMDKFYPRSFNLGVSKEAFTKINGYSTMRFGEDIDFSLRLIENGLTTKFIPEAFVYHKRRSTFKQFFKQVYNSGIARINLYILHPKSLKLVHLFPSIFTILITISILLSPIYIYAIFIPILISLIFFFDSLIKNKSIIVAIYSIASSFIQLFGYGLGFIKAFWNRLIINKKNFSAFDKTFYK